MKKQILYFVTIVLFIGINSCKKDNSDIPSDVNYLEITVNGKTYDTDNGGIFGFSGKTCDAKAGFLMGVGQIETSELFFEFDLKHYEDLVDFEMAQTSSGNIKANQFGSVCNFDAVAEYDDKTVANKNTILKTGGVNNVTSIKKLSETSMDVDYVIQGNFSCIFINDSGKEISVTGKYNVITYVLK